MRLRPLLLTAAALVALGACGQDKEPTIEAGACISIKDKAIKAVDCASAEADKVLVDRIAEGFPCRDGLTGTTIQQTLNGRPVAGGTRWCTGTPGQLTQVHKDRITKQKAEDAN